FDFSSLLRPTGKFTPRWQDEGGLTTPPCTEGVTWNVAKTPVCLGLEQYDALVELEKFNARYIQDRLKLRQVLAHSDAEDVFATTNGDTVQDKMAKKHQKEQNNSEGNPNSRAISDDDDTNDL
ncbi:hypothetical protein BGX27_004387, partial [Mortierella sp. AM989]